MIFAVINNLASMRPGANRRDRWAYPTTNQCSLPAGRPVGIIRDGPWYGCDMATRHAIAVRGMPPPVLPGLGSCSGRSLRSLHRRLRASAC